MKSDPRRREPAPEAMAEALRLADALGEAEHGPRRSLYRIARRYGVAFLREVLEQAGKQTTDVARADGAPRTTGGTFFATTKRLLRERLPPSAFKKVRRRLFGRQRRHACPPTCLVCRAETRVQGEAEQP